MRRLSFFLVVLVLLALCFFEPSPCQTSRERETLLVRQDIVLPGFEHFGYGIEKFGQPQLQVTLDKPHQLEGDVQVAWVKHYGVSSEPGFDEATAIAIDQIGNVYVTGYSSNELFGDDYLTIKYSPAGEEIWVRRYNNEENGNDKPCAIAVDASGNVYVTGSSEFSGTSWDYVTVKYNSDGKEEWIVRFNGIGNRDDIATAMDIDDQGNVYVTGNCRNATQYYDYDYATVKYNAAGVQQWIRRYAGSGDHNDRANALVVDRTGNVYVTGSSSYLDINSNYTTIKYNSVGTEQWIVRYNGQANGANEANALAVDDEGNVYVTGNSAGLSEDYATIKYNSMGDELWVARYNGPVADIDLAIDIAIDKQGNVYVAGISRGSDTGYDYATIKYNSAGILQWVSRYNGALQNSYDKPSALAVDEQGNVYVTGNSEVSQYAYDYVTVKYNSAGNEQWVARYIRSGSYSDEAPAIAVDSQGNVCVTGRDGSAYATVKYTSAGYQQWDARYNSQGNSNSTATDLAVDESGNVYVAGRSSTSATSYDYATVKYSTEGIKTWVNRYNGRKNSVDGANALALDRQGNVYVIGTCSVPGTYMDYATIKYNSAGTQQWIAYYDGTISDRDEASALEIDEEGNIYVTGKSVGLDTSYDFATIKYDSYGVEDWVARYAGPNKSRDEPVGIALDQLGNVYITGKCFRSDSSCLVTIKYNPAGTQEWIVYYYGYVADPKAIEVDHTGNVYVAGSVHVLGVTNSYDYFLVKYNLFGEEQWIVGYSTGNWNDMATAMAIDDSGNVYVTGQIYGSDTFIDYATCKYNSSGVLKWIAYYNGPANYYDQATALAVDASGNVYVTGYSTSARGYGSYDADYATVKYNSVGVQQWVAHYNSPGNGEDKPVALSLDNFGNVYVTGSSSGYGYSVYTTIKYTQTPTSIQQEIINKPKNYSLSQNYPNPFNPATTIRFALPKESIVTLKIYNLLGQEVATLVDELKPMGEHQVQWQVGDLPSGMYLYRLEVHSLDNKSSQNYEDIKKLILLK